MSASDRETRAAAARQAILDSGDPDLIKRLHLMDAAAAQPGALRPVADGDTTSPSAGGAPRPTASPGAQTGPWGTAMAAGAGAGLGAMGGMMLGTVLGGMVLSNQMREAFATVAEEAGFDPGALDAVLGDAGFGDPGFGDDALPPENGPGDLTQASATGAGDALDGGAGDDDWLSGFFDI